jgi:putative DNA methylase
LRFHQALVGRKIAAKSRDGRSSLSQIMHSLKSYTTNEANKLLERSGQFWQHESYDHWVRDDDELERIVRYINRNPVNANLVNHPEQWYFGSALDRYIYDGNKCGFLLGNEPVERRSKDASSTDGASRS